jgi:pyridoxine 5-phosphate synthase
MPYDVRKGAQLANLGVNIDHVATVREARKTNEPDPVWAATLAELGGADGITIHLREDRRHIQDRDLRVLMESVAVPINLELAATDDVLTIACDATPYQATLVPERREEVTTEGGLDVVTARGKVGDAIRRLKDAGIVASLFLDPDERQIDAGVAAGADAIELHTGAYAHATARHNSVQTQAEMQKLTHASQLVLDAGLTLNAGHGLTYRNVRSIAAIQGMHELNIGHSIIARAIMVGLEQAVRDMKRLVSAG